MHPTHGQFTVRTCSAHKDFKINSLQRGVIPLQDTFCVLGIYFARKI
jgi:hypothetical protein